MMSQLNQDSYKLKSTIKLHQSAVFEIQLSNKYITTASQDSTIQRFKIKNGQRTGRILRIHTDPVRYIAKKGQKTYLSAGSDGKLNLINIKTHKIIRQIQQEDEIFNIQTTKRNQKPMIVTDCGPTKLIIKSYPGLKQIKSIDNTHPKYLIDFVLYNQGRNAITSGDDKIIKIWNLCDRNSFQNGSIHKPLFQLYTEHTNWIRTLCLNFDESKLLSGDEIGTLILTDLKYFVKQQQLNKNNSEDSIYNNIDLTQNHQQFQLWKIEDNYEPNVDNNYVIEIEDIKDKSDIIDDKNDQIQQQIQNKIFEENPFLKLEQNNQANNLFNDEVLKKDKQQFEQKIIQQQNRQNLNKSSSEVDSYITQSPKKQSIQQSSFLSENLEEEIDICKQKSNRNSGIKNFQLQEIYHENFAKNKQQKIEINDSIQFEDEQELQNLLEEQDPSPQIQQKQIDYQQISLLQKIQQQQVQLNQQLSKQFQQFDSQKQKNTNNPSKKQSFQSNSDINSLKNFMLRKQSFQSQSEINYQENEKYNIQSFHSHSETNQQQQNCNIINEKQSLLSQKKSQQQISQKKLSFQSLSDKNSKQYQQQYKQNQQKQLILPFQPSKTSQNLNKQKFPTKEQSFENQIRQSITQDMIEEEENINQQDSRDFLNNSKSSLNSSNLSDSQVNSLNSSNSNYESITSYSSSEQSNIQSIFKAMEKEEHKIYKIRMSNDQKSALIAKRYGVIQFVDIQQGKIYDEIDQKYLGLYSFNTDINQNLIFTTSHSNENINVYQKTKQ